MRPIFKTAIGVAAVLLLGLGATALFPGLTGVLPANLRAGPIVGTCWQDDEIDPDERTEVQATALNFVQALTGPSPKNALDDFAERTRTATTSEEFEALVRQTTIPGGYSAYRPARTYVISVTNPGGVASSIPCGTLSDPGQWDVLRVDTSGRHAFVDILSDGAHNEWVFTVWLERHGTDWHVVGFNRGISRIAGHDFVEVWDRAKAQAAAGHSAAATFLYFLADNLIDRGPSFQRGFAQSYRADRSKFTAPASLAGPFPQVQRFGSDDFRVTRMIVFGMEKGRIVLEIDHAEATWSSDSAADQRNRKLIDGFIAAHPDWSEAADVILARAYRPDGKGGFGTLYYKESGYRPPPP